MDSNRYEFDKESLPELLEFVKTSRSIAHSNPLSTKWRIYLPKNVELEKKIADFEESKRSKIVIDLTENDESQEVGDVTLEEHAEQALNTTSVDDLIILIEENLTLSDEVVTKLGGECRVESVQDMFGNFCESFDAESACKMGNSIVSAKSPHQTTVAAYFCQFILIPKLFRESSKEVASLFLTYLNSFPAVTSRTFSEGLQGFQGCPKNLQGNLHAIPSNHKHTLLRDLIMRTASLEEAHIEIVDCLSTGELNLEAFQKLMDLITVAGGDFSGDKLFGKMLLNVVGHNGANVRRFEEQLRHVIDTHRSVWRGKLLKALQSACTADSTMLSQTLRY